MSKLRVVETDELESSVYLFQNTKHNINIFVGDSNTIVA